MGIWDELYDAHKRKPYKDKLNEIKARRTEMECWNDERLRDRSSDLVRKARAGASLDMLVVEAYALAGEAVRRIMGLELHDGQIMAAIALHEGKLIEMQTGEGKTLAAVLPAYLNAMAGKGVHIVTFNDYLARRDAEWMGPLYRFLGVSAEFVQEGISVEERSAAYSADVTYLTAKEAGFDYLRDSLCYDPSSVVQRPFHFVLVDEADSILIDEARIPLVIAGESGAAECDAGRMAEIAARLTESRDYDTDEAKRNVFLTETGADALEEMLGCGNLYDVENSGVLAAIHWALHAEALLRKDVDYIVRAGKVELIDEWTGRVADKRRWPDRLQAAVEAKEKLKPQARGTIVGSITMRHLLSLYPRMCGMTATAKSSADEFGETYGLDVIVIPTNRPVQRIDLPHKVFTHREAKLKALVQHVVSLHRTGRPVLIGTSSVEESIGLAAHLLEAGVMCSVLNASNDDMEAQLIAQAGVWGAVTVSTNMAGRGVDIKLGGGDEKQAAVIAKLGGLVVLGTFLHESVRIGNQLRGRAGRQGDPGCSQFYVSLEDELLSRFGKDAFQHAEPFSKKQVEPLKDSLIQSGIAHIQRVADGQSREIRRTLNRYADVLEQQRRIVYDMRYRILHDLTPSAAGSSNDPERYRQLCAKFGEVETKRAEKQIALRAIDRCWADHLDYAGYIKEGIHLESIGNDNPLDLFHRFIIEAFDKLRSKWRNGSVSRFCPSI